MVKWTENINGEPYTSRGVRTVRGRVLGNTTIVIWKGAGCLAYVVTTNIKTDGKRIDIHNIGKTLSETARKELEIEFKLIKAEGKQYRESLGIKPVIEKAEYGKTPTKRTITNVVTAVTQSYKYTSLAELNAVLKQFNVIADRGKEDTVMFQKKGLVYSIIDEKGNRIGIPFKASALADQPTLPNLEKKFIQNEEKRRPHKDNLKAAIDQVFKYYRQITKGTFINELQKRNIHVVFRQNDQGFVYGTTFVDNKNKTVFNGSDLGKAYSAKALTERLGTIDQPIKQDTKSYLKTGQPGRTYLKPAPQTNYLKTTEQERQHLKPTLFEKTLQTLLRQSEPDSAPLTPRKKKKRKDEERGMHL